MDVTLSEIKCVSTADMKATWKISKQDDIITVDGCSFVRVSPINCSLVSLVCEGNPHAPNPVPKNFSLTKSLGLASLMKMRNTKQVAEMSADPDGCSLFGSSAKKKQKKLSRQAAMTMRNDKSAMNLEVEELGSVVVMRPIHPNDGLFVEYSDTSIGIVIKFLRESGFDESLATTHEPSLPKGTLKRQSQFLVKYTKNDGNTGHKSCKDLDEVHSFLAKLVGSSADVGNAICGDQVESAICDADA